MYSQEQGKRVEAAGRLLTAREISVEQFESVRILLKGLNPRLDKSLESCSNALSKIKKLQEDDIITLSAESLPEETEEEKERKKALLLFLKYYKQLKAEVERITAEFGNVQRGKSQVKTAGRIASFAKGPFGIVTIVAVLIVGFTLFNSSSKKTQPVPSEKVIKPTIQKQRIQIIEFRGKRIALTELIVGTGSDCDSPHYHAKDHTSVKALDGATVSDPGGCGFGRTKEVEVTEIEP